MQSSRQWKIYLIYIYVSKILISIIILIKLQFMGPELYKEKYGINQEEFNLPRILTLSSLVWNTFRHIYIAFWFQIFFRKHSETNLGAQ